MAKLSVIIPLYNASAYIERCLQSVEQQTLVDLEVIIVDDHGCDNSPAIAQAFAEHSRRRDIRYVFTQTPVNSGPSAARNIGLQAAQGEYVAFLDADDWVEPEMYTALYTHAQAQHADLSCCNAWQDFEDGGKSRVLRNPVVGNGEFATQSKKHFLTTFLAYFWTFIYRREWLIANRLQFAAAKSAEDSSFLACSVLAADRIAQTDQPYYHYVIHSGSLTGRKVWKGADKRAAFAHMFAFARRKGLMRTYWLQLGYVYLKKALLVPVIEMLK